MQSMPNNLMIANKNERKPEIVLTKNSFYFLLLCDCASDFIFFNLTLQK